MRRFSMFEEADLSKEKVEHYAVRFYICHHSHGLGCIILGFAAAFLITGTFALLLAMTCYKIQTLHLFYLLMAGGCLVLAVLCRLAYRNLAQQAHEFAFACMSGGNETYADVRDFYRSYTGEEI